MLVLTRKTRESIVIGRPEDLELVLEITILEIEGGRVRLGFEADTRMPIHRREVWDRICNGHANGNGVTNGAVSSAAAALNRSAANSGNGDGLTRRRPAPLDVDVEGERR
jgi:carbon storage regulator CsrA